MKPTLLITGGGGFIGSHLAEALLERYEIRLFDNFRRNSLEYAPALRSHGGLRVIQGDVLDPPALDAAMEGVESVLHLAAIAGVSSYYGEASRTLRVNILGTLNVLEAMRRAGARRFVDFSTSEVYGTDANNVSETSPHRIGPVHEKRWVYAVSKLASEHFALRYGEEFDLQCSCVRPFNIYGPRQTGEGAISNFCHKVLAGEPLEIYGDGRDRRAWCYVSDLVDGVSRLLEAPEAYGKTFNLGNPSEVVDTRELAEIIIRLHGGGTLVSRAMEHAPINSRWPDIARAREILQFQPKIALEEGLRRTLAWHREVLGR